MFSQIIYLCEMLLGRIASQSWFTQLIGVYLFMALTGIVFNRMFGFKK